MPAIRAISGAHQTVVESAEPLASRSLTVTAVGPVHIASIGPFRPVAPLMSTSSSQ